ncbi:molybdopterin-synthase adenylyltransferase MoeB [Burkholderia thailandensis]|uniref:Molybdopterin-synthase adenylyltransferase n=1 Tax=Burkholderia thailandensis TaxID=57975 RepID=A0AAW9CM15_BURTH|nr:molybdopterin-synthase adenylyltransferase MoeB [Burkholderia thailandensis]AIP66130.1 molybdenum cofactor biosynthesis protein MoeB [Burkholderia thailandensis]AOI53966.1 molybdenum cofactor biosynthesis protein MoeB [Burkholderia thailandensis]MCS3392403.1 molybdopterin-synthase adenylyltransferase MoeB [Burkholderia thailandensis]MCS6425316.1 molybdopterin-synthase adenylyltransferase MoeB [Burkholderia thailandensis]MCS6453690.1 molybdopterin-synthase adenylyltransferase MoeB [Burkholde
MLSNNEIKRYSRHLIMPEIGMDGQRRLKAASVLCVGTGGLGSPLATYLAAAGVGRLGLVDSDVVDVSNLQRQILHHTSDVGRRKVISAKEKLSAQNPEIEIVVHDAMLTPDNALDICAGYDIIADGSDNFPTRYLINDACVLLDKPNVHASIFRFDGQATVFHAKHGPCYRCLFAEAPLPGEVPNCAEGGVLGVLPGLLGVVQATEVIKLILGIGTPLIGRLLTFDALSMRTHELRLAKDPDCPICGARPVIRDLVREQGAQPACAMPLHETAEIGAAALQSMLSDPSIKLTLLDVRDPNEWEICRIEGAKHIPMSVLSERLHEVDRDADIIVYCLAGKRSSTAAALLRQAGFGSVRSLSGGIRAWAACVDPAMPIY